MEPERKIEKLLRNYAKKRRTEAGDSFTLHPATRRLLQGEVTRRAPKPKKDKLLWQLFGGMCPGWIYGAIVMALIPLMAVLLLPALSKSKSRAQTAGSMSNLKQIGAAAQTFAADNKGRLPVSLADLGTVASSNTLNDPASGKPFVYVGGGREIASLKTDSVLAYSPAESRTHAVLFADGRVEALNSAQFSELTNRGLLLAAERVAENRVTESSAAAAAIAANSPAPIRAQDGLELDRARFKANSEAKTGTTETPGSTLALAGTAPAAPASGVATSSLPSATSPTASGVVAFQNQNAALLDKITPESSTRSSSATASRQFEAGVAPASQDFYRNSAAPVAHVPVLSNFEVRQEGETLNFVDADGSIYQGKLQAGALVAATAAVAKKEAPGAVAERNDAAKDLRAESGGGRSPAEQNYFFRVAGTNRSLKQNVVFTGNWVSLSNATQNAGQTRGGLGGGKLALPTTQNQAQQLLFQNSRIAGTAVVGGTNRIKIDALPATQFMNSPQRTQ